MADEAAVAVTVESLPATRRTTGSPANTWAALKDAAPEIAEVMGLLGDDAVMARRRARETYDTHPGFKQWLLANFALNIPTRTIRDDLASIVADQVTDGLVLTWPTYTKRQLDTARYDLEAEWSPIETRLTSNIENVGVLSKNRRLLALALLAERVAELALTERNEKTGQLYLLPEYRMIMDQIAKEKGELGDSGDSAVDALGAVALELAKAIRVQGSGVQSAGQTADFDYDAIKEVNQDELTASWRESSEERE